jgi:hypothetical protein
VWEGDQEGMCVCARMPACFCVAGLDMFYSNRLKWVATFFIRIFRVPPLSLIMAARSQRVLGLSNVWAGGRAMGGAWQFATLPCTPTLWRFPSHFLVFSLLVDYPSLYRPFGSPSRRTCNLTAWGYLCIKPFRCVYEPAAATVCVCMLASCA